ncbi:MAG: TonB-dependent receptor [Candidatus Manganitrophus sp. SA1]|nr:TonB-dependent receptor [Candidatus Manganitrophus morganii]
MKDTYRLPYLKVFGLTFSFVVFLFIPIETSAQDPDRPEEPQEKKVTDMKQKEIQADAELQKTDIFNGITTGLYNELTFLGSENLVYTASKRYEALRTAPVAVTVIPRSHLLSLDGRYLPQILRLYPGMDIIQVTRSEFVVDIRGVASSTVFRPRDVLVLVDNRTVYDDYSGGVEWETLSVFPEDVGRIEIIRGAGSAIHGANAARGVINIITRPPEAISVFESDTTFIERGFRQRFGGSFLGEKYSLKLTGGYDESDLWNRFEAFSPRDIKSARTWRFNGTIAKHLTNQAELRFNSGINTGKLLQHTSSGTPVDNDQTTSHVQIEYEASDMSIRSFWNYRTLETEDLLVPGLFSERTQQTYDLEFIRRITYVGRNSVSFGSDARYSTVKADSAGGEHGQYTVGVFVDDQVNITPDFLIRLAGRLDNHQYAGYRFSPRVGAAYRIDPKNTVKASYNIGYRLPTLSNNFLDFPIPAGPTTFFLKGNKDLKPEQSVWYETGYINENITGLTIGIDLFYVITDNLIRSERIPPNTFSFTNVEGKIKGGGVEVWAQYELTSTVRFLANYSYNKYHEGPSDVSTTAPHKANAGILFANFYRLTGAFTVHYVDSASGIFGTIEDSLPRYYLVNIIFGYQISDQWSVRLAAMNVTDNDHREMGAIGEEISADISLTLVYRM